MIRSILLVTLVAAATATGLPSLTLPELKTAIRSGNTAQLLDDGGKLSAFVLTEVNDLESVNELLNTAPGCLNNEQTQTLELANGAVRTTYATEGQEYPACAQEPLSALDQSFNRVELAVTNLLESLAGHSLYYSVDDTRFPLSNAPKKDHVHVYTAGSSMTKDFLVPRHVDNGMFLVITPFPGHGLEITTSSGAQVDTSDVAPTSVIVLFGLGTSEWLFQSDAAIANMFFPAPHSVPAMSINAAPRTVFARMKVAHADAVPTGGRWTFQDVFMRSEDYAQHGNNRLCSVDITQDADLLRWAGKDDNNCPEGTAYCWMDCLDLPDECPVEADAICYGDSGDECAPDDMDGTCAWHCRPT